MIVPMMMFCSRVKKANAGFIQLHSIWGSHEISLLTKFRIFSSNLKAVLINYAECTANKLCVMYILAVLVCMRNMESDKINHHKNSDFIHSILKKNPKSDLP